jgi:DNA polymerase (family 10)
MDPRTAAHALTRIAALLQLRGEDRFRSRAYETAARAVQQLDTDDLAPLLHDGTLADTPGVGPATLAVLRELVETGDSAYLDRLVEDTPEGLLEMLRVPGLGTQKIHAIHAGLGIETVQELERAARDGRLAALPRFGPKTAEKILKGIAFLKASGARVLFPHAVAEAGRLLQDVRRHPAVVEASVAGSIRRRREVICDVDVVAAVRGGPATVAAEFARGPGVRDVIGVGERSVRITYVDGTRLDLYCVRPEQYAVALFRATGTPGHVQAVAARLAAHGFALAGDELRDVATGRPVPVADEPALYALAQLGYVVPELREGRGEVEAAAAGTLPDLVEPGDVRGVLHCHSQYSDGTATIAEMADAARERGWRYLGITDHSQSASYAGGLSPDAVRRQHDEIDALNAAFAADDGFRVLKGIEADILPCGRVDYDAATLDRFDYVIGSVHSRFGMGEAQMTERVCKALDDPHLTVLGHPTGRLLLTREPYAIDMHAVIAKAAEVGAAIELNADPHRLDLDWTLCREAKALGVPIEIGPDAHAPHGLDNVHVGVGIARKGWLGPGDVLNARTADEVLAFARRRREGTRAAR